MEKIIAKIKTPKNRKRMIRDLPVELTRYLHPSLQSILTSRQRRWNKGSPHFRLAVNLINKYRRQVKPRVLPFYCSRCHLATRRLGMAMHHGCDLDEKKKYDRREHLRRTQAYDITGDQKVVQNLNKFLKKDGLGVFEKTPRPQWLTFPRAKKADLSKKVQIIKKVPKLADLCHAALEFDDPPECVPISECTVEIPSTSYPKAAKGMVVREQECHRHGGDAVFCFRCKIMFHDYNAYSVHLESDDFKICKESVPEYQHVDVSDRTGYVPKGFDYTTRRARQVKRDVSHLHCTLCKTTHFESPDALYTHMLKCYKSSLGR